MDFSLMGWLSMCGKVAELKAVTDTFPREW